MLGTMSTVALLVLVGAAVWTDVRERRIPNALTIPALVIALVLRSGMGLDALGAGLLGAGIGLAVSFPLFVLGGFGAGDGKLLMAVGAFLGPQQLAIALLVTGLVGGLMALVAVIRRGALVSSLVNTVLLAKGALGGPAEARRTLQTPGSIAVPYGVAIACGALVGVVV